MANIKDIARLAAEQDRLLKALWPCLAPGGRLLYMTCSLLREENEARVAAFLAAMPKGAARGSPPVPDRRAGTRRELRRPGVRSRAHEGGDVARILHPWRALDAGGDVNLIGAGQPDRLGDIGGGKPAGQHPGHRPAAPLDQPPVE